MGSKNSSGKTRSAKGKQIMQHGSTGKTKIIEKYRNALQKCKLKTGVHKVEMHMSLFVFI